MELTSSVAYIYDGTLDGLFTAVFDAYERKEQPALIAEEEGAQLAFGQDVSHVATDGEKARRVEQGIHRTMGEETYTQVWNAFLSCDPDRATKIYRYLRVGFSVGRRIENYLTHEDVLAVNNMARYVTREAHLLKGFLRFSQLEGGVYYARIEPNNNALPLLMPHFAERYSVQPFLIQDPGHRLAGIYDTREWYMVEAEALDLPKPTGEELDYREMWKRFYDTIGIKERYNPKCRRTLMPMRYWKNMTEMNSFHRMGL